MSKQMLIQRSNEMPGVRSVELKGTIDQTRDQTRSKGDLTERSTVDRYFKDVRGVAASPLHQPDRVCETPRGIPRAISA